MATCNSFPYAFPIHPFATWSVSIFLPNPKLLFHIHLPHTTRIRNNPHQPLTDILDLIVLVQETDMAFHSGSRVISKKINSFLFCQVWISHVLQLWACGSELWFELCLLCLKTGDCRAKCRLSLSVYKPLCMILHTSFFSFTSSMSSEDLWQRANHNSRWIIELMVFVRGDLLAKIIKYRRSVRFLTAILKLLYKRKKERRQRKEVDGERERIRGLHNRMFRIGLLTIVPASVLFLLSTSHHESLGMGMSLCNGFSPWGPWSCSRGWIYFQRSHRMWSFSVFIRHLHLTLSGRHAMDSYDPHGTGIRYHLPNRHGSRCMYN